MAIKKDASGKRWVEMELVLSGTPEQLWQAMATGAGYGAWFTPTSIEQKFGGAIVFDFGAGMTSSGEVVAWEPPHHFGYIERGWSEGAPPIATEITIAARAGGTCVVRMVHSMFTSSDAWDDQMEGFESGWPGFFDVLRVYLAHFAGRPAASTRAMAGASVEPRDAWKRMLAALDLAGADVGDRRATPASPQRLAGTVEAVHQTARQRHLVLRLDEPMSGVAVIGVYAMGGNAHAGLSLFFYGDDAAERVADAQTRWNAAWPGIVSGTSSA